MEICKDLSTVTTMSVSSIDRFMSKFQDCLTYSIQEALSNNKTTIELDIYIGKILVEIINDKIYYKFIPSASFEREVTETVRSGVSPMVTKIEDAIQSKIMRAYKELY